MNCDITPLLNAIISSATSIPPPLTPPQIATYVQAIRAFIDSCGKSPESSDSLFGDDPDDGSRPEVDARSLRDDYEDPAATASDLYNAGLISVLRRDTILEALADLDEVESGVVASTRDCSTLDLESDLLMASESIAGIFREVRDELLEARTVGEGLDASLVAEMRDTVGSMLSRADTNLEEAVEGTCLDTSRSMEDRILEDSGLLIHEGRVLPGGEVDPTGWQQFVRRMGSLAAALGAVPEYDAFCRDPYEVFEPRFILITETLVEVVDGTSFAGTGCTDPEVRVPNPCLDEPPLRLESKILGVDVPVSEILRTNPGLEEHDLIHYFFWVPKIEYNSRALRKARGLGVEAEWTVSVAGESTEEVRTYTLDLETLKLLEAYLDGRLESFLMRQFTGPISVTATSVDVVREVREATRRRPGAERCGVRDPRSSAVEVLGAIDIVASFPDPGEDECWGTSPELDRIYGAIDSLMDSVQSAQQSLQGIFSDISLQFDATGSTLAFVDNFIADTEGFECIFGAGFNFSLGGTTDGGLSLPGPLKNLELSLSENLETTIGWTRSIQAAVDKWTQIPCMARTMLNGLQGSSESGQPPCSDFGAMIGDLPICLEERLEVRVELVNLSMELLGKVIRDIRSMIKELVRIADSIEFAAKLESPDGLSGCSATTPLLASLKAEIEAL